MTPRLFLIACFAALGCAALAAVGAGIWLIEDRLPEGVGTEVRDIVVVYGGGIAFLLVAVIAVLWAYLDYAIAQPLSAIVKGIQTVVLARSDYRIEIEEMHQLDGLPAAVNELIRQLGLARTGINEAIEKEIASLELQKTQLEAVLLDLHEGVIVGTLDHRILLYNNRAVQLLRIGGDIGLDRSLFHFLTRQPILHALSRLTTRLAQGRYDSPLGGPTVAFVGSTVDGKHTLQGRMSLILAAHSTATGYVLSFEDDTEELAALGLRDRLLRESTEGLRAPVGNLRAAAEILVGDPGLGKAEQDGFKKVLLQESKFLCDRLEVLSAQYRDVITGHWPMSEIYSSNLLQNLTDRLREQRGIEATIIGLPQWLHGDSYSLVELLDRLIARLSAHFQTTAFDLETVPGERWVYLDVLWDGAVLPAAELDAWLVEPLEDVLGGLSLREIVERHKTDVWSLPDRPGRARLRLPLPPPAQPVAGDMLPAVPPRPEFYDFDLLRRPLDLGDLAMRPLKALTYVVFDTETTGLEPSAGDEIVSIAGVRIVNGRILTGESFERMVNPRRVIPVDSIRFHGITDELVRDKPPIQVVLPQFRAFVGDAVLVAHNAAFDLKFLELRAAESGVAFDMAVLDTMLLSCFLHDYTPKHNLDVVAQRFGIPVHGRHTALGDALVTAGCFLKMLEMLDAHGVATLGEALAVSERVMQARTRKASF
ncbi:MAG TPA: exonuclease domain-containing protein, partial [Rhodospirillales bacterium]|nr:exonuclease domain-containing protein [Rhodospirillales bacterium]